VEHECIAIVTTVMSQDRAKHSPTLLTVTRENAGRPSNLDNPPAFRSERFNRAG